MQSEHPSIIKPIIRDLNIGPWLNWIDALDRATGKYIAYCEGDDYWTDINKIQKQICFLEKNQEYGLIWTDIDMLDVTKGMTTKSIFRKNILKRFSSFNEILLNKPFLAPSTWVFRSELSAYVLKIYNSDKDYVDGSFPFVLEVIRRHKIKYLPFVSATYRKRSESLSNSSL